MADSKTTPSQKTAGDVKTRTAAPSAERPAPAKTHSAAGEPATAQAAAALVETSAQTKAMSDAAPPLGGTAIGETAGSIPSQPSLTKSVAKKPIVTAAPVIPAEKPKASRSAEKHAKPDAAEIEQMVAEAAYYLAEKRSFVPGFEEEDWAAATAEVMARLR